MTILRALVFKEDDLFVAQCLEHDVCVQSQILGDLGNLIQHQMDFHGEKFYKFPPAPEEYQDAWG